MTRWYPAVLAPAASAAPRLNCAVFRPRPWYALLPSGQGSRESGPEFRRGIRAKVKPLEGAGQRSHGGPVPRLIVRVRFSSPAPPCRRELARLIPEGGSTSSRWWLATLPIPADATDCTQGLGPGGWRGGCLAGAPCAAAAALEVLAGPGRTGSAGGRVCDGGGVDWHGGPGAPFPGLSPGTVTTLWSTAGTRYRDWPAFPRSPW